VPRLNCPESLGAKTAPLRIRNLGRHPPDPNQSAGSRCSSGNRGLPGRYCGETARGHQPLERRPVISRWGHQRSRHKRGRLWRQALRWRLDGGNCCLTYIRTVRCHGDGCPRSQGVTETNIHTIAVSLYDDSVGVNGPYDATRDWIPDLIAGHALRCRILEVRDGIVGGAEDHTVEAGVRQRDGGICLRHRQFRPTRAEEIPMRNDRCGDDRGRQTRLHRCGGRRLASPGWYMLRERPLHLPNYVSGKEYRQRGQHRVHDE